VSRGKYQRGAPEAAVRRGDDRHGMCASCADRHRGAHMNGGNRRHSRGCGDRAGLVVRDFDVLESRRASLPKARIAAESAHRCRIASRRIAVDCLQPSRSGDRETSMWMVMTGHALRTRAARGVPAHTIHIDNARVGAPVCFL